MLFVIFILILFILFRVRYSYSYSYMTENDIHDIDVIESKSYNSLEEKPSILFKQYIVDNCPELSLVVRNYWSGEIVGVIYGGLMKGTDVTVEKMKQIHDPHGDTLIVHSQCVRTELRGRGIGRHMANHYYYRWITGDKRIHHFATCVRERHIEWMKEYGYTYVGPSELELGEDRWYDIRTFRR
jgi:GNAT superfamily N-acetyltransferase